jgi:sulfatase maturation enzyme AslB (radical SAM superfamily)
MGKLPFFITCSSRLPTLCGITASCFAALCASKLRCLCTITAYRSLKCSSQHFLLGSVGLVGSTAHYPCVRLHAFDDLSISPIHAAPVAPDCKLSTQQQRFARATTTESDNCNSNIAVQWTQTGCSATVAKSGDDCLTMYVPPCRWAAPTLSITPSC